MQSLLGGGLAAIVVVVMRMGEHAACSLRQPLLAPLAEAVIWAQLLVFRSARQRFNAVDIELR